MDELIDRLEKATGPDRGIDADIALTVGPWTERHGLSGGGWVSKGSHHAVVSAPSFTASIDVALTLVPDGLDYVLRPLRNNAEARVGGAKDGYIIKGGQHHVPAIALCIAALKARTVSQNP